MDKGAVYQGTANSLAVLWVTLSASSRHCTVCNAQVACRGVPRSMLGPEMSLGFTMLL